MKKNKDFYFHFKEFRGLSNRTNNLLATQESYHLDFKRSADRLKPKDIVAFANSKYGGTILIGVEETKTSAGIQRGRIIGCQVDDGEKIKILNKAQSCIPAVEVEVIIENTSYMPIFRLEIPGGKNKPYCTSEGIYIVRGDGRNNPLPPNDLLAIIMAGQSKKLFNKFNTDAFKLDRKISQTRKQVEKLSKNVDSFNVNIKKDVENLFNIMQRWSGDINTKFDSFLSFYRLVEIIYNTSNEDADHHEGAVFKH